MSEAVTAVILTFNEEIHVGRCIEGLRGLATRVVVVDSYSTDRTVEIARELGAEVLQNPFTSHATQFNWGVETARIDSGWILRMDADEWLEAEAVTGLAALLPSLDKQISAVTLRRKVIFQGRWIRWGGYYPIILTRLWRAGRARVEQRWVDEHVEVLNGEIRAFRGGDLVDENLKDLTEFTGKHNSYTTKQALDFLNLRYPLFGSTEQKGALPLETRWKRFLRNRAYHRAPLYLRAALYFMQRYILRLGFLDGRAGVVFHTLQGFWNLFLIDAKIDEAERFIQAHGLDAFRAMIEARHGIRLVQREA